MNESGRRQVRVTGHRAERLAEEADANPLGRAVWEVVRRLAHAARDAGFQPWLLSPLAEGADRLVARVALVSGYRLRVVLPFPRSRYEKDFGSPRSLNEFRTLLGEAQEVEGLSLRGGGYAAVGEVVARNSSLLIAIGDGAPAQGAGGTQEVVAAALKREIPVVWIPLEPPHRPLVLPGDEPFDVWLVAATGAS